MVLLLYYIALTVFLMTHCFYYTQTHIMIELMSLRVHNDTIYTSLSLLTVYIHPKWCK